MRVVYTGGVRSEQNAGLDAAYRYIERIAPKDTRRDEPLSRHTTLRVGGPADLWIKPRTVGAALDVLSFCQRESVPHMALGRGSNVLVSDSGWRGAVINLSRCFRRYRPVTGGVMCGAGLSLPRLVRRLAADGFSGLEWAGGIPGTVGGAVVVNAGAHGAEMSAVVKRIVAMVEGERRLLGRDTIVFSYRGAEAPGIVLEVEFELNEAVPELAREKIEHLMGVRERTQPVWKRTAGCIFKNPPGDSAGRIIDSLGLKGIVAGAARVSELHANFIVNADDATAADVFSLIRQVRERVRGETGVQLELEVELIGDFAQ